jgi:hypothetical protein
LLLNTKKVALEDFVKRCANLYETYKDFEYTAAALYMMGEAYFAYADMIYNAPTPEGFTIEMEDLYFEALDEVRLPLEDEGRGRLETNLQTASDLKQWSEWHTKTLALLNEKYPTEFAKEKDEKRAVGDSSQVAPARAVTIRGEDEPPPLPIPVSPEEATPQEDEGAEGAGPAEGGTPDEGSEGSAPEESSPTGWGPAPPAEETGGEAPADGLPAEDGVEPVEAPEDSPSPESGDAP